MSPIAVSVAQACELAGLSKTKIYELIGAGRLAKVKIGRRTLIKVDSIRALLNEGAQA